jgi:hypothetical protein
MAGCVQKARTGVPRQVCRCRGNGRHHACPCYTDRHHTIQFHFAVTCMGEQAPLESLLAATTAVSRWRVAVTIPTCLCVHLVQVPSAHYMARSGFIGTCVCCYCVTRRVTQLQMPKVPYILLLPNMHGPEAPATVRLHTSMPQLTRYAHAYYLLAIPPARLHSLPVNPSSARYSGCDTVCARPAAATAAAVAFGT